MRDERLGGVPTSSLRRFAPPRPPQLVAGGRRHFRPIRRRPVKGPGRRLVAPPSCNQSRVSPNFGHTQAPPHISPKGSKGGNVAGTTLGTVGGLQFHTPERWASPPTSSRANLAARYARAAFSRRSVDLLRDGGTSDMWAPRPGKLEMDARRLGPSTQWSYECVASPIPACARPRPETTLRHC